jgi:hypothetical protein
MLISFVIWTVCSAIFDQNGSHAAVIVVIAFIFVVFFHYDIAYTPLLLGYPTEIFPLLTPKQRFDCRPIECVWITDYSFSSKPNCSRKHRMALLYRVLLPVGSLLRRDIFPFPRDQRLLSRRNW